jgi:opacity protein-like surface antigen
MLRSLIAAAAAVALYGCSPALAGVTCYGELSAGKTATATSTDIAGPVTVTASGLQGGVGIGCDYTIGATVIGALARYEIMDVHSTLGAGSMDVDAMWTLAMRAGIKINPGTLVYGLLGMSGTEVTYPGLEIDPTGITYGAGLEFDIARENLTAFVEWSHTTLDERRSALGVNFDPESDTIRVGVRLKFDLMK